jgi:hypothetical protein
MGDKGKKDKGKKEHQKKAQRSPKEKRQLKREKKNKSIRTVMPRQVPIATFLINEDLKGGALATFAGPP